MDTAPSPAYAAPAAWAKSSFSGGANACVEVRFEGDQVLIRDSKYRRDPTSDPSGEPVIAVAAHQWARFCDQLTGAAPAGPSDALIADTAANGTTTLRPLVDATCLTYTAAEWTAFLNGLHSGELRSPSLALTAS
jgi:hypothetical protein